MRIGIIGAGLVGSLLAIYLKKRGCAVSLYERRPDSRKKGYEGGRSINLALSNRGLRALREVGLEETIRQTAIPMHGRMMHSVAGELAYQPYGREGEYINSISRSGLNHVLLDEAERLGATLYFEHRVAHVDLENTQVAFARDSATTTASFDYLIGADGAFSAVRSALQLTDRFNFSQHYIEHGYKELTIPSGKSGHFQLEKNALHIWPRESYMLIALPNPDGSFTCTLFFPFHGNPSFESLQTDAAAAHFFQTVFPDAAALIPDVAGEFRSNPTASLVTMKCYPWVRHRTLLMGDSAHAIVPFYGQGMNAGFEDCRILNELLDQRKDDWQKVLPAFQQQRKPDADAIAELALDNFVEMRDRVADPQFLLRKKIEARLHELFPDRWIPLYSMVTFHDSIRYSEAQRLGREQQKIMDEVMRTPGITQTWENLDFKKLVDLLESS